MQPHAQTAATSAVDSKIAPCDLKRIAIQWIVNATEDQIEKAYQVIFDS